MILIVEDEPYNIDAIKILLQCALADHPRFQYIQFKDCIKMANNGQKAVDQVKDSWQRDQTLFSAIFMDCNMPIMDGYEATERIRKFISSQSLEQPFIFGISGHIEDAYRQRALDSGINRVIAKPAKLEDIVEAVKETKL